MTAAMSNATLRLKVNRLYEKLVLQLFKLLYECRVWWEADVLHVIGAT